MFKSAGLPSIKDLKEDLTNVQSIFEIDKVEELFGHSQDQIQSTFQMFEVHALLLTLKEAKEALDKNDPKLLKETVHKLKGAASYVTAQKIVSTCIKMDKFHQQGRHEEMFACYPTLIEQAIEFRFAYKKILINKSCKYFVYI